MAEPVIHHRALYRSYLPVPPFFHLQNGHTHTAPPKPNAASDQQLSSRCCAKQNKIKYAIIKRKTNAGKSAPNFPAALSTSSPFNSFYWYISACKDRHTLQSKLFRKERDQIFFSQTLIKFCCCSIFCVCFLKHGAFLRQS